jgi:glycosyltransferase involved in cell wall biosynthesis
MTRISVVAPNLDEERFLPCFLNSLANQTFKDFEVVIVDGGSKDRSLSIIGSFRKRLRMRVVIDRTRNIGYVRNIGASASHGDIIIQTSSDTFFEPQLLEKVDSFYSRYPELVSLAARTFPMGTSPIIHIAYQGFDFMRFLFTVSPFPLHKYRPSGNFMCCRKAEFERLGGYPEVKINEDGLFGQKLDTLFEKQHKSVIFSLQLWVGHHAKRAEAKGGIKTIFFYLYVFSNMFPFLKPLLAHIERKSAETFVSRSDLGGA